MSCSVNLGLSASLFKFEALSIVAHRFSDDTGAPGCTSECTESFVTHNKIEK